MVCIYVLELILFICGSEFVIFICNLFLEIIAQFWCPPDTLSNKWSSVIMAVWMVARKNETSDEHLGGIS